MESLDIMINKFEKMQHTHPNFSKVWTEYLNIKKKRIQSILNQGEHVLKELETSEDLEIMTILLLKELAITLP